MATLNDPNIDFSESCRMIFVRDEFLNEKYFRQKGLLNSICDRHKVILCRRMYFEKLKPKNQKKKLNYKAYKIKKFCIRLFSIQYEMLVVRIFLHPTERERIRLNPEDISTSYKLKQ